MISLTKLRSNIIRNPGKNIVIKSINHDYEQKTHSQIFLDSYNQNNSENTTTNTTNTNIVNKSTNDEQYIKNLLKIHKIRENEPNNDRNDRNDRNASNANNSSNSNNSNNSNNMNSNQNNYDNRVSQSILIYTENEVIDLPELFNNIISNANMYYIYGNTRIDNFLRTIILSVERDYILKNKRQRRDHLKTVRTEMALGLDKIHKKQNYPSRKFKKGVMCQNLLNDDYINESNMVYTTDYFNINICIINLSNMSFDVVGKYSQDRMTLLTILDDGIYLPILSTTGNHLHKHHILDKLNNNLHCSNDEYRGKCEKNNEVIYPRESNQSNLVEENLNEVLNDVEVSNVKRVKITSILPNGKLEPERKYKAPQLREIAQQLSIVTTKEQNGKTKNKTKKELYSEIADYCRDVNL